MIVAPIAPTKAPAGELLNLAPETIGRYQLITRLAVGGMAEIFLACERGIAGLERRIVIKRILPQLAEQERFLEMFLREARIVARISHPNVVGIHELGEDQGQYYIAMEYLEGLTARELVLLARDAGTHLPVEVCIEVVVQSLRGLHAMHELKDLEGHPLGLVHRDVSPQNLMVTRDGHVKLVDFGIAKATEGIDATYTGSLKGKFSYMSPEQCENHPLDRRTDLFTLGIVLWELVTQERLFKRDTEVMMLRAVCDDPITPAETIRPDLPTPLSAVIQRSLKRDPKARFQSAEAFRTALVDAADKASLELGPDCVQRFLKKVAGEELRSRLDRLNAATERTLQSITQQWRKEAALVKPAVPDSEDLPTVTEGPSARVATGETPKAGSRRWLLIASLAVLIGGGVLALVMGRGPSGPPVTIAWPPYVDAELLRSDMEPLRQYLEETLDRPVEFLVTETYASCGEGLRDGDYAFAALSPLLYVRTLMLAPELELVAVKEFDGTVSYEGWVMARSDSTIRSMEDLDGKRFCFTNEDSTSGYLLPRAYLRRLGFEPDEFIGGVHWSGKHDQAILDLLDDQCEAVATYNGAVFSAGTEGIAIGALRFIATTGTIPQDVIVAGPSATRQETEAVRNALLSFDPQTHLGTARVGTVQRITGFEPVVDSAFDDLRIEVEAESSSE